MDNISTPKWDVEIYSLHLSGASFRSANALISANTGPGVDVGWVSSATVFLFYDQTLIGEVTLKDTIINTELSDEVLVLDMEEFEIQDMIAFKSFIRDIMPKPQNKCQSDKNALIGKVEVIEKGHKLTMAIDLYGIGGLTMTKSEVMLIDDDLIQINFDFTNATSVEIFFGKAEFRLQKDLRLFLCLSGRFDIEAHETTSITLEGKLDPYSRRQLSGNAVLTGHRLIPDGYSSRSYDKTWLIHALREFKIEVDLDRVFASKPV
ncbi:hypothetical protein Trisim1_012067 [Trichoderma cf. simile WF8]